MIIRPLNEPEKALIRALDSRRHEINEEILALKERLRKLSHDQQRTEAEISLFLQAMSGGWDSNVFVDPSTMTLRAETPEDIDDGS